MTRTMIGVLTRVTTDMSVSSGTPTVRHSGDSSSEEEERGKGGAVGSEWMGERGGDHQGMWDGGRMGGERG